MRAYVYTDKSLGRYAGRFVWLSVNTENAKNAEFLGRYPIPALPTLLVLNARGDEIVFRYVGGATIGQLTKMLDSVGMKSGGADAILASADKLASQGKHAEAAKLYAEALQKAPKAWRPFGRTAESMMFSLSMSNQSERCASEALRLLPRLKGTVSGASVAVSGLGCSLDVEPSAAKRAETIASLDKATRQALDDSTVDLSADDRSGLYITLISAREDAKDEGAAKKLKEEWSVFLDESAAKTSSPEQRTVYDSHRLSAYIELGTPEKAIPMLEQSERDFPEDYNPPHRLSIAYKAMKEYDKAVAASDRALKHAYGPRKLTMLRARADLFVARGDKESARKTISEAIVYARQLPKEQRRESTIAALEKKLTELSE